MIFPEKLRKLIFPLLTFLLFATAASGERPKIGLALSGGGALGLGHIGVLQKIDSLDIPIDYIAGTSMGGIIGGLYAMGYSGEDLENLADTLHWEKVFRDEPSRRLMPPQEKEAQRIYPFAVDLQNFRPVTTGLIHGHRIQMLLARLTGKYMTIRDFSRLPVPFRCVAVDLNSGEEVILQEGSLPRAMRATMSIPSIFTPVPWGDSLLIDGGLLNNLPTEVVREMGADVVIASAVSRPAEAMERNTSIPAILSQSFQIARNTQIYKKAPQAEVFIMNELPRYSIADFFTERVHEIVEEGHKTASSHVGELIALKARLNLNEYPGDVPSSSVRIDSLSVHGLLRSREAQALDAIGEYRGEQCDSLIVKNAIQSLLDLPSIENVTPQVKPLSDKSVHLAFVVTEAGTPLISDIEIRGNRRLSGELIRNAIDIYPGQRYNLESLEKSIEYLFSLGYFRKITYDLEPTAPNSVKIELILQEHSFQKVRLGAYYNNRYKLVPEIRFEVDNLLVNPLQLETDLAIMGYESITTRLSYRKPHLNYALYPFLHLGYENKPRDIYNGFGERMTTIDKRSWSVAGGFGLEWKHRYVLQLLRRLQYVDITPRLDLEFRDTTLRPDWSATLQTVEVQGNIDWLDNYNNPTRGILLRGALEVGNRRLLGSAHDYLRGHMAVDWYLTPGQSHMIHTRGFAGGTYWDTPIYKQFFVGGPDDFPGLDYHQLLSRMLIYLRADYSYEVRENLFLKLIGNFSPYYLYHLDGVQQYTTMLGYGVGVKYETYLGPVELTIAQGPHSIANQLNRQTVLYLTAGYRF